LADAGFIEGRNVALEFRWASGDPSLLPEMASDLIRRGVAVIITPADTSAALIAKAATTTIPIVFAVGGDPVAMGLVGSLNRPGSNVTGIGIMQAELTPKRLGLFHELVPAAAHFSAVVNPSNVLSASILKQVQIGATALGIQVDIVEAGTDTELDVAFAGVSKKTGSAVLMGTDAFFFTRRAKIAALAAQYKLPTCFDNRAYAEAGGLISYGADVVRSFEQVGVYVGRILKGEKPGDLPIEQSAKFETVINLKTAKALDMKISETILLRADEVIE
jgi:putative ABC transport system substrate-binding protein